MPTVTLNKTAFEDLVGKKLPLDKLKDRISMIGTDLEKIEGDQIHVEIFPNRPDWLSEQGFARSFAAFIGVKKGLVEYRVKKSGHQVIVDSTLPKEWPYAVACLVRGLSLDTEKVREIIQLQEKLGTTLTRGRKKGGIGLYPASKIAFPVRFLGRAPNQIRFKPLGFRTLLLGSQILSDHPKGKEYGHICEKWEKLPLFIDANNVVMSMPPIINSEDVGKVDSDTKDLFVEATGPDLATLKIAMNIIVTSLSDMGGRIESIEMVAGKTKFSIPDLTPTLLKIDRDYVKSRLGIAMTEGQIKDCLERMGYGYNKGVAQVPAYRADVLHPVDLVEDIAIAYGYENMTSQIPRIATIAQEDECQVFIRKIATILVGLGYLETNTYVISGKSDETQKMMHTAPVVELANSLSEGYDSLRASMMPSLLRVLSHNKHHAYPQNLFESGVVVVSDPSSETTTKEIRRLGVVLCDDTVDFTKIKQVLDLLMRSLGIEYTSEETEHSSFLAGRVARIAVKGTKLAYIGEISPAVLSQWGITKPVAALELNVDELLEIVRAN